MSGNAHQRKIAERLIRSSFKKINVSPEPSHAADSPSAKRLGRSSVEAYLFFIVALGYSIMSAFGFPVNFWAGIAMCVCVAIAGTDLLLRSEYTQNWNRLAKGLGVLFIWLLGLIVVNQGYVRSKLKDDPNAVTLSAIQNLTLLVRTNPLQPIQNTQVLEVDGKYPDVSTTKSREVVGPAGPIINVDYINNGSATAYAKRVTGGRFIAGTGKPHEDAMFRLLYKHEADREKGIPVEDLAPKGSGILPIGGEVRNEYGEPATDSDRTDVMEKKKVLYIAVLIVYQDRRGRTYHTESCHFATDANALIRKCVAHNGHG